MNYASSPYVPPQSAIFAVSFLCMATNFCIVRDTIPLWASHHTEDKVYTRSIQFSLAILVTVSVVIGAIIFSVAKNKIFVCISLNIGSIIGNVILKLDYNTTMAKGLLGYVFVFTFASATLPCIIDIGFHHIHGEKYYLKSVSIFAGLIFFGWACSQVIAWNTLLNENDKLAFDLALVWACLALAFFFIAWILARRDIDDIPEMKKQSFWEIFFYLITFMFLAVILFIVGFLQHQLVDEWIKQSENTVRKISENFEYNENLLYEHYLHAIVFLIAVYKFLMFRQGTEQPFKILLIGVAVLVAMLLICNKVDYNITKANRDRMGKITPPIRKVLYINILPCSCDLIFYNRTKNEGYIEIYRTRKERFEFFYFATYSYVFVTRYVCPTVKYDKRYMYILDYVRVPGSVHLVYKRKPIGNYSCSQSIFNPNEYKTEISFGEVCIQVSRFLHRETIVYLLSDRNVYYASRKECMKFLPGKYRLISDFDNTSTQISSLDVGPGGVYVVFISLPDDAEVTTDEVYPMSTSINYVKPITITILYMIPQFILLIVVQILLFISSLEFIYSRNHRFQALLVALLLASIKFGYVLHLDNNAYKINDHIYIFILFIILAVLAFIIGKILMQNCGYLSPILNKFFLPIWLYIKDHCCCSTQNMLTKKDNADHDSDKENKRRDNDDKNKNTDKKNDEDESVKKRLKRRSSFSNRRRDRARVKQHNPIYGDEFVNRTITKL